MVDNFGREQTVDYAERVYNGVILLHSLRWSDKHGFPMGIYTERVHLILHSHRTRAVASLISACTL